MQIHHVERLVRRGMEELARRQQGSEPSPGDGGLDDIAGRWKATQVWPAMITMLLGFVAIYLVSYSIGQLMSALTMIESTGPSRNVNPVPLPPQYSDESPSDPLMEGEPDVEPADTENVFVERRPITGKIRTTMAHLSHIGGFRGRLRGLGWSVAYNVAYSLLTQLLSYGMGTVGAALGTIFAALLLARLHMFWTHSMIASPESKLWRRQPKLRDCKPLILPALVYAVAQEAGIIPLVVANALGIIVPVGQGNDGVADGARSNTATAFGAFAVLAIFAVVTLAVIVPASITLTRLEAFLLPEGDETIVPFDKAAIAGDVDFNLPGNSRALFLRAWQTFTRDGWWRLVKLYAKLLGIQIGMLIVMGVVVGVEIAIFG